MVKRFLSEESITVSEEIKGVKTLITEKEKARDFFKARNARCWEKNDISFFKKTNALKRGTDETEDEIKTLQKNIGISWRKEI